MKLTKKEVEHIAHLSRLGLSEEEQDKFATQLSSILDYVAQLQEVNTTGVEPTAQVTGLENVMCKDIIDFGDPKTRAGLLKNAPATEDNLIKANAVFE